MKRSRNRWAVLPLLAFGPMAVALASTAPIVTIQGGQLRGTLNAAGDVEGYYGIPYAAPPVGALRWQEPQPVSPWKGVRSAERVRPGCPQTARPDRAHFPQRKGLSFDEDCLYLNVFTPANHGRNAHLPVMLWVHGGGLMMETGLTPVTTGEGLARKNVVLVTVDYRLGPLGFLVLPELTAQSPHHVSGNYGLLDQIAALKWLKDNIAAFGGDPSNITVFGFSAGSTSVNALQASPLARGLFQRAIGESTADMNPAAGIWHLRTVAQAEALGAKYMASLGAHSVAELRAMPVAKLLDTPIKFWLLENDGYVLPGEIYDLFAAGKQAPIPVLAGATANESTTLGVGLRWVEPQTPQEKSSFAAIYGPNGLTSGQVTDDVVLWQMREWVRLNAKVQPHNSFLYYFSHASPAPPGPNGERLGAYHGVDLPYVFRTLHALDWPWSPAEERLMDIVSSYWVNFARTGDPNGPGLPHWPAYDERQVMELSLEPRAIPLPRADAIEYLTGYFAHQRAAGGDNLPRKSP
jgi:para-nitrobenzyl esterase